MRKFVIAFLLFVSPAFADTVDVFNFNVNAGDIGKTDLLKKGLVQFLVSGFNSPGVAGDIWEKNLGVTEFGLGLRDQTDHEIGINGNDFLQVDISKLTANKSVEKVDFGINSIQLGESYDIWGSNTAGALGTLIAANQTAPDFTVPLAPYQFISVTAGSGDVLLNDVTVTATPEPSSALLFISGVCIVLAGKLFRRKETNEEFRARHGW
jgi:hypothetical protein